MYVALFSNNSHSIRMKQFTIEIPSLNCWRKFFPNLRLVANSIESRFRKAIKSIWKTEAGPMSHHLCQLGAITLPASCWIRPWPSLYEKSCKNR
jgi:hypothetical protein